MDLLDILWAPHMYIYTYIRVLCFSNHQTVNRDRNYQRIFRNSFVFMPPLHHIIILVRSVGQLMTHPPSSWLL